MQKNKLNFSADSIDYGRVLKKFENNPWIRITVLNYTVPLMYQAKCQNTKTFSFPILEISRKTIAICQINLDLPIVIDNIINIFWQFDNVFLISDELEITIVGINKCTFVIESERISK